MEILSIDLDRCLSHQQKVSAAIASGDPGQALDLYLEHYDDLHARAALEWRLLIRAVRAPAISPPDGPWPEDLLLRRSGASLAFAVAQANGGASDLPAGLLPPRAVPRRYRPCLAAAWRRRPDCPALAAPELRRSFAAALAEDATLSGPCACAAALAGDRALAGELADRWLERGLGHRAAPGQIADAGRVAALAEPAAAALRLAVGLFYDDAEKLLELAEAAFELAEHPVLLDLGAALLERPLTPDQKCRILELRLAALAEDPRTYARAAAEYRELWQPLAEPYPLPELLLYAFQQLGENGLERHLLENAEINEMTPRWVALSRERLRGGVPSRRLLETWAELYAEESGDERVLVGVTSAVLRCPRPLRLTWADQLGLAERWRRLASHEPYRHLAGAFLVRLQEFDEERITVFETYLADAALATHAERLAARAYVAALRRSKRLDGLDGARREALLQACSFEQGQIAELLHRLRQVDADQLPLRRWCEGWERLLGLPLSVHDLVEIVDHFLNLSRELETAGRLAEDVDLYEDVRLQLLRRAKAAAEELLELLPLAAPRRRNLAERLERADLSAVFRILQELIAASTAAGAETREPESRRKGRCQKSG